MNHAIIKFFFLYAMSFYIFFELSNIKIGIRTYIQILACTIFLSTLTSYIVIIFSTSYFLGMLVLFLASLYVLNRKQQTFSIFYGLISVGLSYIIFAILALSVTLILFIFLNTAIAHYITHIAFVTGLLSILAIYLLLRNKRFKKSLYLICNNNHIYMYAFVCSVLLLIILIAQAKMQDNGNNGIYLLVFFSIMFILLHIVRREVQKYYLAKLKKLELESLRQELAEKDAMIQKLKDSNDHLAHLVHQDNKLIPAMESAVQHYLTDAASTPETQLAKGQALAQELQKLAEDRQGNLTSYHSLRDLPHTGHAGVDAMLSHMQDRALAQNIEYK